MSYEDEDDTRDAHRAKIKAHLTQVEFPGGFKALHEASYTVTELDILNGIHMDAAEMIRVWQAVESVRQHGFPEEFWM